MLYFLLLMDTGVFYAGLFCIYCEGRDQPPFGSRSASSLSSLSTRLFDNYDDQRQRSHRPETRALAGDGARDALLALAALRGLQGGRDA